MENQTHVEFEAGNPAVVVTTLETAMVGEELIESDLLIEDVSIDGMCGVY